MLSHLFESTINRFYNKNYQILSFNILSYMGSWRARPDNNSLSPGQRTRQL